MQNTLRTEGIIIYALDFREHDRILTLFSHDSGIMKFFVKGARTARHKKGGTAAPLTLVEILYRKGKSDLLPCQEISLVNSHLELRKSLPALEAACDMLQVVQQSQFPDKPAPALYQLLLRYLGAIPHFSSPEVIAASFRLKLLRHEGLLGLPTQCSTCGTTLTDLYLVRGESFCRDHAKGSHLFFSEEEANQLLCLAFARTLADLHPIRLPPALNKRIKELFEGAILLA